MGETMVSTVNRHGAGPSPLGPCELRGGVRARASSESVLESHVQRLPFARRAKNTRGVAVRPSPTSALTIAAHSVCRTPPGSRPPRGEAASCVPRVDVCPPRKSGAPHRGCRPSAPRCERAAGRATTESFMTSGCLRRFERHRQADRPRDQLEPPKPGPPPRLRFRETHPRTRAPFHRTNRPALVTLRLPESPSPHPSGCDPDEAFAQDVSFETRARESGHREAPAAVRSSPPPSRAVTARAGDSSS